MERRWWDTMPKLQMIKRTNGSVVYSVNIPLEMIEQLEWVKGIDLDMVCRENGETPQIQLFKKEDELNEKVDN